MEKIERFIEKNLTSIAIVFLVLALLIKNFNNIYQSDIHYRYEERLREDLYNTEISLDQNKKLINLLIGSRELNQVEKRLLDKYVPITNNSKIVILSKFDESIKAFESTKNLLKEINNKNGISKVFYITDTDQKKLIKSVKEIIIDDKTLQNVSTPSIYVLSKSGEIHLSFTIKASAQNKEIELIQESIKNVLGALDN